MRHLTIGRSALFALIAALAAFAGTAMMSGVNAQEQRDGCLASDILHESDASVVWRYDGVRWTGYAEHEGEPIPGAVDFAVANGETIYDDRQCPLPPRFTVSYIEKHPRFSPYSTDAWLYPLATDLAGDDKYIQIEWHVHIDGRVAETVEIKSANPRCASTNERVLHVRPEPYVSQGKIRCHHWVWGAGSASPIVALDENNSDFGATREVGREINILDQGEYNSGVRSGKYVSRLEMQQMRLDIAISIAQALGATSDQSTSTASCDSLRRQMHSEAARGYSFPEGSVEEQASDRRWLALYHQHAAKCR